MVLTEALFEAYLDEGGTHARSPILSVAGFFGVREQWSTYLAHWPHTEFHACESKYDHLKPSLSDAIEAALLCGTEVCFRPGEFKSLASGEIKAHLGNAYAIGAFLCVAALCEKAQVVASNARLSVVLEDGQPNIDWVRRMLIMMMTEFPIASVTIAKKSAFPQLHAADFLAHSRAVTDIPWMNRLFARGFVNEIPIDASIIANTSEAVTEFMRRYRWQKTKERRERKQRRDEEEKV